LNESSDRDFKLLFTRGTQLLHEKKADQAVELLERARLEKPDHLDVHINLGGAYILNGQFSKAAQVLEVAVAIDPDSAMAWTNLGAAYLGNPVLARDEEQLKAVDAFERVLSIDPQAPHVAYNIGLIYRDRKEWNRAVVWFKRAVRSDPSDEDARSLLAKMKTYSSQN